MSLFSNDDQGTKDLISKRDIILESDSDLDGAGDIILRTGGVERARIKADGTGTGWPNVLGGSISFLVASGDTTGTTDTAALQAAIDAASGPTTIVNGGKLYLDTVTIDGKTDLTIVLGCAKRIASPSNPSAGKGAMFRVGETSGCTNLTIDVAELDGNNFAGTSSTGRGIRVSNCTGFTFKGWIHHTWNHAIAFGTTASSSVYIDARLENIGIGYTADNTFSAQAPAGCGVIFATEAPVTDGVVVLRNSRDIKGGAAVYVGGCTRLEVHLRNVRRCGYRALACAGTATVTSLKVIEPDIEDCGAVHETSTAPGNALYGQGTNGIYVGNSPVTAQDAVILGGKINKCGENAIEGLFIAIGTVTDNTAYRTGTPYSGFGSGIAGNALYPYNGGSRIRQTISRNVGDYGIQHYDATSGGMNDIVVDGVEVSDAAVTSVLFQQDTQGTATGIIVRNVIAKKGTGAATHGVRFFATAGGSFDATCQMHDVTPIGTFSTAPAALTLSGGGTMKAVGPFLNSIYRFFQNSGQVPASGFAYMVPFEVDDLFLPTNVCFNFNAVDNTKKYDVGIYDQNAQAVWRLGGGAAVTAVPGATGDVSLTGNAIPALTRGQYYWVFGCNDGTTTKVLGTTNFPAGTVGACRRLASGFDASTGLIASLAGHSSTGLGINFSLS